MLTVQTGENRLLPQALVYAAGRALADGDDTLYIVVPGQLTLLTERLLLDKLHLSGSFRLRVLTPARLCTAIFEEAGFPEGERIDARGRVMLVRRAVRESEGLSIYRDAGHRRGFCEKCARQIELMTQYGITPDMLRACAGESSGSTALRLNDLATISETLDKISAGLYLDGETELTLAAGRAQDAPFLDGARFFFFGFDLIPPTLIDLFSRIACRAASAVYFCPARPDAAKDDVDAPVLRTALRLAAAVRTLGGEAVFESSDDEEDTRGEALKHLGASIFSHPQKPLETDDGSVILFRAKDTREECCLAAATARRLASKGMRYGEMQLVCADLSAARQTLIDAFALYDVPLFLNNSRAVSRMAVADALLTALKLISNNYRREDVSALMRTGLTALTREECDGFADYCLENNIEGSKLLRPLTRGREEVAAFMEPLRARLIAPVEALHRRLKAASTLREQLKALFDYLEDIDAYQHCVREQEALKAEGLLDAAGTLSQAWNRLIGALDQMAALMGEKKLSMRELSDTLSESLDAAVVKPLPQSGDAVFAQGDGQLLMQEAKAVFFVGMNDRASKDGDLLLSEEQNERIARHAGVYPGPTAQERVLMRRYYVRAALGMAKEKVFLSYALSSDDGAAGPGAEITEAQYLLPGLKPVGDSACALLLANAPAAASAAAARYLAAKNDDEELRPVDKTILKTIEERVVDRLPELKRRFEALNRNAADNGRIDPELAAILYKGLDRVSVTALEKYANCPFSYFMSCGLRAESIKAPEFKPSDEGSILHRAINDFLRRCGDGLSEMSAADAAREMDGVMDILIAREQSGAAMADSAVTAAECERLRQTARTCAAAMAEHMKDSRFRLSGTEREFGVDDKSEEQLRIGNTTLYGRIDRLDESEKDGALRIIDFKLGGRNLDLGKTYHGLSLQLPLYMAAALKGRELRDAGFFYFPLSDGIVSSDSTQTAELDEERRKAMRMNGLLPLEEELLEAHTPRVTEVFDATRTKTGGWYKSTAITDARGFERLLEHAKEKAGEHIEGILGGEAAVSPAIYNGKSPCEYCELRAGCLMDKRCDGSRQRKKGGMKWNEVMDRLALDEGGTEEEA